MGSFPRVAFVHHHDLHDARTWSGTPRGLLRALQDAGVDVAPISPLVTLDDEREHRQARRHARDGQRHHVESAPGVVAHYARQVEQAVRAVRADVLLAVNPVPIAGVQLDVPVVMWTDATYALLHDRSPTFTGVSAQSVARGWAVDAAALGRCRRALYSSAWAAQSAHLDFDVPVERLGVVPYGANLDAPPTREDALAAVNRRRDARTMNLLWIGVDWQRKGGDTAVEALRRLRALGVPATLTMVGAAPPARVRATPHVRFEGFLNKNTPEGRARLDTLLAAAHVLILPSRMDCTPMVVAEAGAFALPVLAPDVGGMASVLHDGVNGVLLPSGASALTYAERAASLWRSPAQSVSLARAARGLYDEKLNWRSATARLMSYVGEAVQDVGPVRRPRAG